MTDIPPEDLRLIGELEKIRAALEKLQNTLTVLPGAAPRPGCACGGGRMCAHHAQVFTQLTAAGDRLLFAQAQLRRE